MAISALVEIRHLEENVVSLSREPSLSSGIVNNAVVFFYQNYIEYLVLLNETSLILLLSLRPALIFKELCTLEHYHKSRRPFFILDRDPS